MGFFVGELQLVDLLGILRKTSPTICAPLIMGRPWVAVCERRHLGTCSQKSRFRFSISRRVHPAGEQPLVSPPIPVPGALMDGGLCLQPGQLLCENFLERFEFSI